MKGNGWLGSTDWALFSLVLVSIWGGAVSTIIYVAGLQHIPEHLKEAARIIVVRARAMQDCGRHVGAMLAVGLDEEKAADLILGTR